MTFPFSFGLSPEEVQRQKMATAAARHQLVDFFGSMNRDQLESQRKMLINIVSSEDHSGGLTDYLVGLVDGELYHRFDVCIACSDTHQAMIARGEDPFAVPPPEDPVDDPSLRETPREKSADENQILHTFLEYNLDPRSDPDKPITFKTPGRCKNCNQDYASLDDRMLRPPGLDGCPGCVQKTKWG